MSSSHKSLVVELGSVYIRGGFSGDHAPRFMTRHQVFETELSMLRLYLQELFNRIYTHEFLVKPKQTHVLIIEKMFAPRVIRDHILSVLLKDFHVQSVSFQPDLYMSLLPTGWSSGIILNIGQSECQALCISNGRPIIQTLKSTGVGVNDCVQSLTTLLNTIYEKEYSPDNVRPVFERIACHSYQLPVQRSSHREKEEDASTAPTATATGEGNDDGDESGNATETSHADASVGHGDLTGKQEEEQLQHDRLGGAVAPKPEPKREQEQEQDQEQDDGSRMVLVSDVEILPSQGLPMGLDEDGDALDSFVLNSQERQQSLYCLISGDDPHKGCVDESGGAAGILLESLRACPRDARYAVANNVVVCGGGAMIPGLPQAICAKAGEIASTDQHFRESILQLIERLPEGRLLPTLTPFPLSTLAFLGGSIFSSVPASRSRYVTLRDLERHGKPSIIPAELLQCGATAASQDGKYGGKEKVVVGVARESRDVVADSSLEGLPIPPATAVNPSDATPAAHPPLSPAVTDADADADAGGGVTTPATSADRASEESAPMGERDIETTRAEESKDVAMSGVTANAADVSTDGDAASKVPALEPTAAEPTAFPSAALLVGPSTTARHASPPAGAPLGTQPTAAWPKHNGDSDFLLAAPDWQSLDSADWVFYRGSVFAQ